MDTLQILFLFFAAGVVAELFLVVVYREYFTKPSDGDRSFFQMLRTLRVGKPIAGWILSVLHLALLFGITLMVLQRIIS
jgi:hypothetical protein